MAEIELTKGKVAFVDEEDLDRLNAHNWCFGSGYAVRKGLRSEGLRGKTVYMHRQILGLDDPETFCDHINHNRLDNRKENLRVCSCSENGANRLTGRNSGSGFKGVTFIKNYSNRNKPWRAFLMVRGRGLTIGYFATKEQAAVAYNEAAKQHFGEFAKLNVTEEESMGTQELEHCIKEFQFTVKSYGVDVVHSALAYRAHNGRFILCSKLPHGGLERVGSFTKDQIDGIESRGALPKVFSGRIDENSAKFEGQAQ